MKKLSLFILSLALFASCEKNNPEPECYHAGGITFINKTGLYASVDMWYISTITTVKPGEAVTKPAHIKRTGGDGWICLVGREITITMYDKNTLGQPALYEFTDIISDTVIIDSTEFKH